MSSVQKIPSWRDEALALDQDQFQGHLTAELAFFGSNPVVQSSAPHAPPIFGSSSVVQSGVPRVPSARRAHGYVPTNLFHSGEELLLDLDMVPEPATLVSKSVLKRKEENEADWPAGLFVPAKVNEMKKLFRFGAVEAVRAEDFVGQVLDARFVLTFKPGIFGDDGTVRLFDNRLVRPRARFVVRGFQEHVDPLEDMSSPTPLWSSVRLVALQAVNHGCPLSVSDVTAAETGQEEVRVKLLKLRSSKRIPSLSRLQSRPRLKPDCRLSVVSAVSTICVDAVLPHAHGMKSCLDIWLKSWGLSGVWLIRACFDLKRMAVCWLFMLMICCGQLSHQLWRLQ